MFHNLPRLSGTFLLPVYLCGLMVGCAKEEPFYPVSGKILLDGQPLTGVGQGSVSLRGDLAKGNKTLHQPTGAIKPGGDYEVITVDKKGAPPGWYKVVVSAFANKIEEGPVTPRPLLDPKYYNADTTDLSIEVVAEPSPDAYDLNVTK
jgi:hypothetical protein